MSGKKREGERGVSLDAVIWEGSGNSGRKWFFGGRWRDFGVLRFWGKYVGLGGGGRGNAEMEGRGSLVVWSKVGRLGRKAVWQKAAWQKAAWQKAVWQKAVWQKGVWQACPIV
jgi:hypothetical protein